MTVEPPLTTSDIWPEEPERCKVCGSELEWVECWLCLGTDDPEDDGESECGECGGAGGFLECLNVPHQPAPLEATS